MHLSLYPIADSYTLVALAAIVLLGLLAVGPARDKMSPGKRAALAGIRLGVVLLVVVAMLRPTLVYTSTAKQPATLVVMADASRSLTVPDAAGGRTRWDLLRQTLDDARGALRRVDREFELKGYVFDATTRPVALDDGRLALPALPEGPQTALGAALEDVLQAEAGKRLLGVVLLSDGNQQALAPRNVPPQTAAGRMKSLGAPLYTVALGQARGLGQAKDVRVAQLVVNPTVFVKNKLPVRAQLRVDGYANRPLPVELLFEKKPGKLDVVARKNVQATDEGQILTVDFDYVPETPGEFMIGLRVPAQPGELVKTNNELRTFVNVLSGGLNVLYLEGTRRVEQRYLRWSLDASADINVDYLWIDPKEGASRPSLADRFAPGRYEVYLLGDIDSTAFQPDELKLLAEAVRRGAGLMALGGFHSFGAGGYAGTPLADVLPVKMDRFERQPPDGPVRAELHVPGPFKMRPTPLGLRHFALSLADTQADDIRAWEALPALEGANRWNGFSAGAQLLAVGGRDVPLLVSHSVGAGRVMAFAADSTWHWWMQGHQAQHQRFWRQAVLWLARKDQAANSNVWIKLDNRRFAPGERVEFTVGANSAAGQPLPQAEFKAELIRPDGTTESLRLVRRDGQTAGSIRDTAASGDYTIRVSAADGGTAVGTTQTRFLVFEQDMELDNPAADADTLETLAATTGGERIAPEQLPRLIERLAEKTKDLEVKRETKATFWDTWSFLFALVGLLSVEWFLRKRWGLV